MYIDSKAEGTFHNWSTNCSSDKWYLEFQNICSGLDYLAGALLWILL